MSKIFMIMYKKFYIYIYYCDCIYALYNVTIECIQFALMVIAISK